PAPSAPRPAAAGRRCATWSGARLTLPERCPYGESRRRPEGARISQSGRYSAQMDASAQAAAFDWETQPECVADVPFEIKEALAEGHFEPDRPPSEREEFSADAPAPLLLC